MERVSVHQQLREFWLDYRSEVIFGVVLIATVVLSYWLGAYIPEDVFEHIINPIQYVLSVFACLGGAYIMLRHHDGMLIRKSWAAILILWGVLDTILLVLRFGLHVSAIGSTPDNPLYNATVSVGNMLAFFLFIYPTQVLRPGWLTWKKGLLLFLPVLLLALLDFFVPADLLPIIMIYPAFLFFALCAHVRSYRIWCEDNFSSMDNIDVQWIIRYLTIMAVLGVSFYFISFCYTLPNRMFTQQWLLFFMIAYATEQILFRPDPWREVRREDVRSMKENSPTLSSSKTIHADRSAFEQWMEAEKPYTNPAFQLMDVRAVLPKNRTYLSQFINTAYGCSFFHLVNRYRIEEAQRLMSEHPNMKLSDVAARCGFSSPAVFSRTFARETGVSPREWKN